MSPDERRAAIVEATIPLLQEYGSALTTKQIAEASGIAEGTVFRAFGTKEEIVHACAHAVFDTSRAVAELGRIERDQSLDERLTDAVAVMQGYLRRAIGLIMTLHASGIGPPRHDEKPRERRSVSDPAVEAALVALIGEDAATLRLPASEVVNILAHLTFASAHPMFPVRGMSPGEIVSVILDGTRKES